MAYRRAASLVLAAAVVAVGVASGGELAGAGDGAGEVRAVWDHFAKGLYEGDWARTALELKRARISDVFVNVAGPGFAHYDSAVLPHSSLMRRAGDQLAAALAACVPQGIRGHAWVMCFSAGRAPERQRAEYARRGWCLKDREGADTYLLDPSNEAVRSELLAAIGEIARRYPVAGVHLDYARWRDFPSTRATPAAMRAFAADNPGREATDAALFDWRARKVGAFVAEARRRTLAHRPHAVISAAVYGKYPSCVNAVGQDWHSWLEAGVLDWAVPMDYTEDAGRFAEWTREQSRTRFLADRVVAGIGVTASESRLDASAVRSQIAVTRSREMAGFALFDLDEVLRDEIFPAIASEKADR